MPEPTLREGESVVFSIRANRREGYEAVAGKLTLTNQRLWWVPGAIDALLLQGTTWEVPLASVAAVGPSPRDLWDFLAGGIRIRLSVRARDGKEDLFVVNGLDEVIAKITATLPKV